MKAIMPRSAPESEDKAVEPPNAQFNRLMTAQRVLKRRQLPQKAYKVI